MDLSKIKHPPLLIFIVKRIFISILLLFLLGFTMFALMELAPGDIVDNVISSELMNETLSFSSDSINIEETKEMKESLGLNKPFYVQYGLWLKRVFIEHDVGTSLISKAPITFLIKTRLRNTLVLNLISLVFISFSSFFIALYLSRKAGTKTDYVISFVTLFITSIPPLLLLLLFQLFASTTGLFPTTAYPLTSSTPVQFTFSYLHHIFLPLLASFIVGTSHSIRIMRNTMLDQIGKPYILALRSRGISEKRIYLNHALKNTLNPFITGSASLLASLFSGSMVLEIIFSYPGLGSLM